MEPATFRLMKAEVHDLTLELAQRFHALEPSPTERDTSTPRLNMLREKAKAKQLITFHWAKALLDGRWVRVNGQHSSEVLTGLDGDFPIGLKAHIDEYEVSDLQGLALLFRQFDDRKSGRSSTDVAGAYQNITPELQDVAKATGKLAIEGVTYYRQQVAKIPTPAGDSQYTLFHDMALHDFIKWTGHVFSMKTPEMKTKPVVAAMFATFVAHEEQAKRFWEAVARGGDQDDESAAATILDEWLKRLTDREDKGEIVKVTPAQKYQGCVHAFNAFQKGLTLKGIRYDFKTWVEPIHRAA
jgi:hypothetical protein